MKDILNNIIRIRRSVFPVQYNGEEFDFEYISNLPWLCCAYMF